MSFELGTMSMDASFSSNIAITPIDPKMMISSFDKKSFFSDFPIIFDKLEFDLDTTIPVALKTTTQGASVAASGFSGILLLVSSS